MFFLLRVVFWLGIVFAYMSWTNDARPPTFSEIASKARGLLQKSVAEAQDRVEKACLNEPSACFEAAANMGQAAKDPRDGKAKASPPSGAAKP